MGLLSHLWNKGLLNQKKKLGNACGGLVKDDEDIVLRRNSKWARVLVNYGGRHVPTLLNVVVGSLCYAIQLWEETLPWVEQVVPKIVYNKPKVVEDGI